MTKEQLNNAKQRINAEQRLNIVKRKQAVAVGDTVREMEISERIELYNTVLWALEAAQIAARHGTFDEHIMQRFTRVD